LLEAIDAIPPVITSVMVSSSIALPGTPINISAEVFDDPSGVREVRGIIN